jgi:hypothetical protein
MIITGAAGALCGGLLGLRFRMPVIIPAMFLEIIVVGVAGLGLRQQPSAIFLAIVGGAVGLQMGYLGGVCSLAYASTHWWRAREDYAATLQPKI